MARAYGGLSSSDSDDDFLRDFGKLHLSKPTARSRRTRIHSIEDLERLMEKANDFVGDSSMGTCNYFYRDKTDEYYDNIMDEEGGMMEVYKKDFHGDPKSPINGKIDGLFFSSNVRHGTSSPVTWSVYGPRRLLIDPERIIDLCCNVYFADFYCVHAPHIVTLVLTKPGSVVDQYCEDHLVEIDWDKNRFLRRRGSYQDPEFEVSGKVWVELFVTENVNIKKEKEHGARFKDVEMRGNRSGGSVGLKKDSRCSICNI